jgi:hypothetical protein
MSPREFQVTFPRNKRKKNSIRYEHRFDRSQAEKLPP